jgi:hypothetical protein
MQFSGQAGAITPQGVRAGDPAALAALCERRGRAVLAYCREVCEPADAAPAAAEALARFRAAVWAAGDAPELEPETLLLGATRHAAAASARRPAEPRATRRIVGRAHTEVCAQVPALIVARAESLLGAADQDRLARHLERCSSCRETEAAFRRAERAYGASSHPQLDSATTALLLGALAEAAPIEPAPVEELPAPAPQPLAPEPPAPEVVAEPDAGQEQIPDELDDPDEDGYAEEPPATILTPHPVARALPDPRRGRRMRALLPFVVVAAGAGAAMGVAGVFDGSSGDSQSVDTRTVQSTSLAPISTRTP